jgi:hypothetical protein
MGEAQMGLSLSVYFIVKYLSFSGVIQLFLLHWTNWTLDNLKGNSVVLYSRGGLFKMISSVMNGACFTVLVIV